MNPARPPDFDMDRSPVEEKLPDGVEIVSLDSPTAAADISDRMAAEQYAQLSDAGSGRMAFGRRGEAQWIGRNR